MARDPDRMMARFDDVMSRFPLTPDGITAAGRRVRRKAGRAVAKASRMGMAVIAVIVATLVWGLAVGPIGTGALMSIFLATIIACILLGIFPRDIAPAPAKLATARPALLPAQVDTWLNAKRRSLPALAAPRFDAISAQLASLAPQLAAVPANDPVAMEAQRLLGKHLPELVERYEKVAPAQRRQAPVDGGPTIERQFVDGLGLIQDELARVSDRLGAADRDNFLIQGKFLENRYGKDGALKP
ncbi:MAG: hypothetical protein ACRYG4_13510 [Janthinobacterium lividum]